jgi:hypothetical protein
VSDVSPSPVPGAREPVRPHGLGPVAVFALVLVAQLALVAVAGTDIPFHDQWDAEARTFYPAWRDGTWRLADLFRAHNEHRIAWTHALNLALFSANGQWDPLLQLVAGAFLRAAGAAGLVWMVARGIKAGAHLWAAAAVGLAFLPHLAWHNALWGFQSQVYFSLLFSLGALAWLGPPQPSFRRQLAGLALGGAGLLAMGAAALVPVAVLGLIGLRMIERRRLDATRWREAWPALVLLGAGLWLRVDVPEHAALKAQGAGEFLAAAGRVLSWPHGNGMIAALLLNGPLLWIVTARILRRRTAARGEDFVVLVGGWSAAIGLATAWVRGGSGELVAGLPSRYVDFIVLLPLANGWCAVVLAREAVARGMGSARLVAGAWGAFLFIGWLGLSAEVMRGLVLPRARDREAPVRLMRAFQTSGDAKVFAGQPKLLVPHPNLESVRAVLADPRMRGALPPSLQPEKPPGPLSRGVRAVLGQRQNRSKDPALP